jgi:hypothetical protein
MSVEPSSYGITHTTNYVWEFYINPYVPTEFKLMGWPGSSNGFFEEGPYTFSGPTRVQLVMPNGAPHFVAATLSADRQSPNPDGFVWEWYSTVIKFPDLVVNQDPFT